MSDPVSSRDYAKDVFDQEFVWVANAGWASIAANHA
jgi:hypothetical protein